MIFTQATSVLPLLENVIGALHRVEDLFYDIFFFRRSPIGFPPDLELRNSCQHWHDKLNAWLSLAHAEASRGSGLAWALKVVGSFIEYGLRKNSLWASITAVPNIWHQNFEL